MFGVDEGTGAALALGRGDDLQGQGGLTGGLRTIDFDYATTRQTTDAKRQVQAEGAGGDDLNVARHSGIAHPHDRALAELLLDLAECRAKRLTLVIVHYRLP